MNKSELIGCPCLQVTNNKELKEYLRTLISGSVGGYSVAINASKIVLYNENIDIKKIIDNSILPSPDGWGATYSFKYLYNKKCIKVDLPLMFFEVLNDLNKSAFFLGAKEEVNKKAVSNILNKYPKIKYSGRHHGYFKNEKEILKTIKKAETDVVFIAMGSPKQEILSSKFYSQLSNTLFIGVGGRFDVEAGLAKRAPKFIIDNNLEWLYRFVQRPRALYKRQLQSFKFLRLLKSYKKTRYRKSE